MTDAAIAAHAARPIPADQVIGLYRAQGWWPERTAGQVRAVLGGGPAVGAWCEDRLVGFARAVSDGVLRAYVEDVVVAPDVRGGGIGRALVTALLELLRPVPVVTLFCPAGLTGYYEGLGFQATGQVVLHRS